MARYNLIDEDWIPVLLDNSGEVKKVNLKELFENSQNYVSLACDTKTQEFAILRFLLSILQTVFSRFDSEGEKYEYIELNENFKPIEKVSQDYEENYVEDLFGTWETLFNEREFPDIISKYLDKWHDRFYLFDDKYPFYQVTGDLITPDKIYKNRKVGSISGKNINRKISESGNKIALFSPKYEYKNNKEILSEDEIARWLLTLHGYIGTSDKTKFKGDNKTSSKGWLFDIGGLYLSGENLFETLLFNTVLVDSFESYKNIQRPCWEYSPSELIDRYLTSNNPDNLAELYTTWSRAVYIDPETDASKPFEMNIVKVPDVNKVNNFLEPMTIWRFNREGDNKGKFTPKKHVLNQSMWRSFGNIIEEDIIKEENESKNEKKTNNKMPGIIEWYKTLSDVLEIDNITLNSVSMKDDGNATSWVPVDEICDSLSIADIIITDDDENGWKNRILQTISDTKYCVSVIYKRFIQDIKEIRNLESKLFVDQNVEELYFIIDEPFRDWITSIDKNDSKDEKCNEWKITLRRLVLNQANSLIKEAGNRDFIGIVKDEKVKNIATSYSSFKYYLNDKLKIKEKEENNGENDQKQDGTHDDIKDN
ncbi:type I-E CRISPR-associated protein Cse1/CasA [Peptoniphilus sp.]|jgi:CRISPR system Cascade subunit CasA|uniref:type I-E CRISPR-associated protein Cse1/CasA n=1 Tax=Peptoniphilus sp. TaxID=1971214 RepID=UPI003D8A1BD3